MTTPEQQAKPQDKQQTAQPGTDEYNRSENLLPGDEGAEDGRFEVAEEVSLDMASDDTRRVGQLPGSVTEVTTAGESLHGASRAGFFLGAVRS
jgi:hypothetical protein